MHISGENIESVIEDINDIIFSDNLDIAESASIQLQQAIEILEGIKEDNF
jgi:hypothetical protein